MDKCKDCFNIKTCDVKRLKGQKAIKCSYYVKKKGTKGGKKK